MVGQPEAPEAAAPEVVGGEDVHDGENQEQEHPCHTWGQRGQGQRVPGLGTSAWAENTRGYFPILLFFPDFSHSSLAPRTACSKKLELRLVLEAAKGTYDHYRQVCIHGKMRTKAKVLRQKPQTPHTVYSLPGTVWKNHQ